MGPKFEGPNMPEIVTKLNDTQIKSTKPGEKEVNLFDGGGLFLRISLSVKGGKKNWYFRYAVPVTKKRTKMSLGTYPHLTLAQARSLRDQYLAQLAQQIDPQTHKADKANALKAATEHTLQVVAKNGWKRRKERQGFQKIMQQISGVALNVKSSLAWVMF